MKKATFVDAQEMSKLHPDTFEAPSIEELETIKPNSIVKVCANNKERFWVIVQSVDGQKISGEVNNVLMRTATHGLMCGDIIQFDARHVYQIYPGGAE